MAIPCGLPLSGSPALSGLPAARPAPVSRRMPPVVSLRRCRRLPLPVALSGVGPGSPRAVGAMASRYGRIRGLPGRGDGKIDREPVILGMHRRQLGQSRPMARGAAIAATPTYHITTALAPSSSAPRRRASRRGYITSRAGRGGRSSRRRRVRAVSRHRAPRRRIPWLGG